MQEKQFEDYKRCADISPYEQCNDPSYHCFEYESDWEEGMPTICCHCWIENSRGRCEQHPLNKGE